MKHLVGLILFMSISLSSVTLTVESLTTQNEYVTTYSGSEYLLGIMDIGITNDEDIAYVQMGMSHYNNMGLDIPYGGLVEEHDFTMSAISGSTITGSHNMFPEDHYIPAGTTDETLMYFQILISEENDEEFCIINPDFRDLNGNSLNVNLDENSCISIDEMCLDEDYDVECDNASIAPVSV